MTTLAPVSSLYTGKPAPVHKQAGWETALVAFGSTGAFASAVAFGHAHFAGPTAYVTTACLAVLAFSRKEAPYATKLLKLWNAARKDKKVAAATTKLTSSPEFKAVVAAYAAAVKVPVVDEAVKAVETTVTSPATTTATDGENAITKSIGL